MTGVRTITPDGEWTPVRARDAKGEQRVAVCIPCRNEAATIGWLISQIRTELIETVAVIDDLVVIDDGSTDGTASVAASAGARVVSVDAIAASVGMAPATGKGNVLWSSLLATDADVIVWCDADVTTFAPDWIVRLVLPLLLDDRVALVKADYRRPTDAGGGGRTTELMARPLLSLWFPELATLAQPLAGEVAVRRSIASQLHIVTGWGVEAGMLIDVSRLVGVDSIAQVDLGVRRHRHRPLVDLALQAAEVGATILARAGALPAMGSCPPSLRNAAGTLVPLNIAERPPAERVLVR